MKWFTFKLQVDLAISMLVTDIGNVYRTNKDIGHYACERGFFLLFEVIILGQFFDSKVSFKSDFELFERN